ncbi:MAG: glycosyltransferase family 9 protein [Bryobacterales bacterium]|nr:glycosyltransferase family 9 protein [Bryobacterales bacterium]
MTSSILVVRLGAMGDVIHALPAAASLKQSFPHCHLAWVIDPRWAPLLDGNKFVDQVIPLNRRSWASIREAWGRLRAVRFDLAVDFQGLIKSALVASAARAGRIVGYHISQLREVTAAIFYSKSFRAHARHIVDRHLELAAAAGATSVLKVFPVPEGEPEGQLPESGYVLASPFAGWTAKEWPIEYYSELARILKQHTGLPLVLNGHPGAAGKLQAVEGVVTHISSIAGLIHATRHARAVVGVDSGPLHLAAALAKPGVAIFGPTDPARNGPYGDHMVVLRAASAQTTYKRHQAHDDSMRAISPDQVAQALVRQLQ